MHFLYTYIPRHSKNPQIPQTKNNSKIPFRHVLILEAPAPIKAGVFVGKYILLVERLLYWFVVILLRY
jgi:hypothetical protein